MINNDLEFIKLLSGLPRMINLLNNDLQFIIKNIGYVTLVQITRQRYIIKNKTINNLVIKMSYVLGVPNHPNDMN